jgi:hypothetical protein
MINKKWKPEENNLNFVRFLIVRQQGNFWSRLKDIALFTMHFVFFSSNKSQIII